jgi:hypothetical protein
MATRGRLTVVASVAAAVLGVAAPAFASWAITATNPTATAKANALDPVAGVVATPASTSVTLTWNAPSGTVAATSYTVTRTAPTTATVCSGVTVTTCTDTGLSSSTTYSYSVVAVRDAWNATGVPASATTLAGGTPTFTLTPAAGPYTAGSPFAVTVEARLSGLPDPTYTGDKTLVVSGAAAPNGTVPTITASPISFVAGSATVNVTLFKSGSNTFTVADTAPATRSGSATLTVLPGKATLGFTATTVGGTSVTCSPTTAIDGSTNNVVLATKVLLNPADTWGNAVTIPTSGSVSVAMALSTGAAAVYNTITNPTLTIALSPSNTTSALTYSAKRSNSSAFTGTLTATDTSGTYAPATCALFHS